MRLLVCLGKVQTSLTSGRYPAATVVVSASLQLDDDLGCCQGT